MKMIQKYLIATILAIWLLVSPNYAQERAVRPALPSAEPVPRQALVIGNAAYTHTSPLRNPVNDAQAISKTLRQLGFSVTTLLDTDQRTMEANIAMFGRSLKKSDGVGLFYYAGHGMQVEGENYLFPIDINPQTEADVRYDGVPVGKLLGQMGSAGNNMNLVILDACRNNPFARSFRAASQGLAQVIAPTGSFISYATAPGQVAADGEGGNGLFTSKLLKHMIKPGLKLEEVFKQVRIDVQEESNNRQVPWDSSSLTGDFYFVPAVASPPESNQTELVDLKGQAAEEQQAQLEQQQLQAQWEDWQQQMEQDFQQVLSFNEQAVSPELKIQSLQRFLENWQEENPFSEQDKGLRSKAQSKLDQWQEIEEQNSQLAKIMKLLQRGELQAAGKLLSNYNQQEERQKLVAYFIKQAPSIQYSLARVYRKGAGLVKNEQTAFTWYKQAAENGYAKAQTMLGYLYQIGGGTAKTSREAVKWYTQAAEQGESMALFNLGNLYLVGEGVNQDEAKARELLQKAAAQGNRQARQVLKTMED